MNVAVRKESVAALGEYARIPIRFMVERILDIRQGDSSIGFALTEQVLADFRFGYGTPIRVVAMP